MSAPIITIDVEKAAGRYDRRLFVPTDAIVSADARALAAKLGVSIVVEGESPAASTAPAVPPQSIAPTTPAAPVTAPIPVAATPYTFVPPISAVPLARPVPVAANAPRSTIPVRNVPLESSRPPAASPARRSALPLGIVVGKTVRSIDIYAARAAGYSLVRHSDAAYITRAARHAAALANVSLFADPDLRIAGRPDGPGTVINPLELGGAISRTGSGVLPNGALPIGGDQDEGSLGAR